MVQGRIVISDESCVVTKIFEDYIAGISFSQIAKALYESGTINTNGTSYWSHTSIARILRNEKYCGKDQYPSMIATDLFIAAGEKRNKRNLDLNRNANLSANLVSGTHHFYNKIRCGECGSEFKKYKDLHDKTKTSTWRCKRHLVDGRIACQCASLKEEQIEQAFLGILGVAMETPSILIQNKPFPTTDKNKRIVELNKAIEDAILGKDKDQSQIAALIFQRAQEQYRISNIDDFQYQTNKIMKILQNISIPLEFDSDLLSSLVKQITVYKTKQLRFEFMNGAVVG